MGNVSDAVIQFLSSSKTRMTILGLLVLTIGLFTTIYLVGQQQDIRQRAASEVTCSSCAAQGSSYFCRSIYFVNSEFCSTTNKSDARTNITCLPTSSCSEAAGTGLLRVETSPATGATIRVISLSTNQTVITRDWAIEWEKLPAGNYSLSFSYNTPGSNLKVPPTSTIPIVKGETTIVVANFTNGTTSVSRTPITTPAPTVSTTGGGTTSTACNNCLAQGKKYSCPSFGGFTQRTCSDSSLFGLCTKCEEPQASPTLTPTPTLAGPTAIPTNPIITPPVFCNDSSSTYSCGTGQNSGNILKRPSDRSDSVHWQCQTGTCTSAGNGCFTCGTTPQATLTPIPTVDPTCANSTGKANGCVCDINAHCASGFCGFNNQNVKVCQEDGPTTTLTCDPNKDGVINILDFQWWKDEGITLTRTTKEADCFNPDGVVNLADFQVWKDIAITGVRQPF